MPEISIRGLTVSFYGVTALEDISLDIPSGELTAIVGPSGCGKSTLLNVLTRLVTPSAGCVEIGGVSISERPTRPGEISYMLATDSLFPWRTAARNVELGLQFARVPRTRRRQIASDLLDLVGLSEFRNMYPAQLSQGMRQRVAVARTLATDPEILLMDEPFAALDAQTRRQLQLDFLRVWEQQKSTVVFVTHDVVEAVSIADRVVVITSRPGRVKSIYDLRDVKRDRNVDAPFDSNVMDFYTKIWRDLRADGSGSPVVSSSLAATED